MAEKGPDGRRFPPTEFTTELAIKLTTRVVSRHRFLQLLGGTASAVAVSGALGACSQGTGSEPKSSTVAGATTPASLVRLSSVVTPQDGGLYDDLLPDFERRTGYRVELTTGEDVYGPARNGQSDVVLSHYGHKDAQAFVQDGFGQWPQTVFFNQHALLGPPSDPAQVQDLTDLVEAFRRIAQTRSPFIVNDNEAIKYLAEVLWKAAGSPEKEGWYSDPGVQGQAAIAKAAQQGGYVLWGLTPFLRTQQQNRAELQPLVLNDPLLQRIMVTVAVNPAQVPGVNVSGAEAFQQYLLDPATQARIRAFRLPGIDQQIWWPAGRNNAGYVLPKL
jgi:tungstate transport system substrate-binding protein